MDLRYKMSTLILLTLALLTSSITGAPCAGEGEFMSSFFTVLTKRGLTSQQVVENDQKRPDVFNSVYATGMWQHGNTDTPLSGSGSTIARTEITRAALKAVILKYKISSIIDASCGDLTWIKLLFPFFKQHNVKYIGIDIVKSLIEKHQHDYPEHTFMHQDIVTDVLPQADLLFSRHTLQHMNPEDNIRVLHNWSKSKCKYVLQTTYTTETNNNWNIVADGHSNLIDLNQEPYNLPDPTLKVLEQKQPEFEEYIALWKLPFFDASSSAPCPGTTATKVPTPAVATAGVLPFKIIVLTQRRTASLVRLLNSIQNAEYDNANVHLQIRVDGCPGCKGYEETVFAAKKFKFNHGTSEVVLSEKKQGLIYAWFNAWTPASDTERVVIIEDDMELSPYWFKWLQRAWEVYEDRDDMGGISLCRQRLQASTGYTVMFEHSGPFLYRVPGSFGFSPHAKHWGEFVKWSRVVDLKTDVSVPGTVTTGWHLGGSNSWEQYWIWWCWGSSTGIEPAVRGLYTLYIHLPGTALIAHWAEPGEHSGGSAGPNDVLTSKKDNLYIYPELLDHYNWDFGLEQPRSTLGTKGIDTQVCTLGDQTYDTTHNSQVWTINQDVCFYNNVIYTKFDPCLDKIPVYYSENAFGIKWSFDIDNVKPIATIINKPVLGTMLWGSTNLYHTLINGFLVSIHRTKELYSTDSTVIVSYGGNWQPHPREKEINKILSGDPLFRLRTDFSVPTCWSSMVLTPGTVWRPKGSGSLLNDMLITDSAARFRNLILNSVPEGKSKDKSSGKSLDESKDLLVCVLDTPEFVKPDYEIQQLNADREFAAVVADVKHCDVLVGVNDHYNFAYSLFMKPNSVIVIITSDANIANIHKQYTKFLNHTVYTTDKFGVAHIINFHYSVSSDYKHHLIALEAIAKSTGEGHEGHCDQIPMQVKHYNKLIAGLDQVKAGDQVKADDLTKAGTICEVGFNIGHSALRFLHHNPKAHLYSFDIANRRNVVAAIQYIQKEFPDRFHFTGGNSKETLPKFRKDHPEITCDLSVIDGGHSEAEVFSDMAWLYDMTKLDGIIVVSNTGCKSAWCQGPSLVWNDYTRFGIIDSKFSYVTDNNDRGFSYGTKQSSKLTTENGGVTFSHARGMIPSAIGQITESTTFGQALTQFITDKQIKRVIETGTWYGGGSTHVIAKALKQPGVCETNITHHICSSFVLSFESYQPAWEHARFSLQTYPAWLVFGSTVGVDDMLSPNQIETKDKHYRLYYERDRKIMTTKQPELKTYCEKDLNFELGLIDGNRYTSWAEFNILKNICKVKYIAFRETSTIRTNQIEKYIGENPSQFIAVNSGKESDNIGWTIYELVSI